MTAPAPAPSPVVIGHPNGPARLAAAAGVVAVAALLASFVLLPADPGGTSAGAIADRYSASGYLTATVVQVLGVVAAVAFAAGLAGVLRTAGRPLAGLVTAGVGVAAALQLTGYAVIATLAAGTAERAGDDVVLGLYDLSSIAFAFSSAGWALALAGAAAGILRTGAVARWLGWAAAGLAVVALMATGALAPEGFLGVHGDLGFLAVVLVHLWVLLTSIALLRRRPA